MVRHGLQIHISTTRPETCHLSPICTTNCLLDCSERLMSQEKAYHSQLSKVTQCVHSTSTAQQDRARFILWGWQTKRLLQFVRLRILRTCSWGEKQRPWFGFVPCRKPQHTCAYRKIAKLGWQLVWHNLRIQDKLWDSFVGQHKLFARNYERC